jgi:hypothetical protein
MKVLIGFEESQTVCIAFRNKGHESYSCDLEDCSGGHPVMALEDGFFQSSETKRMGLNYSSPSLQLILHFAEIVGTGIVR